MKFVEKLTFHGSQSPCKTDYDAFNVHYCPREFFFFRNSLFGGHFLAGENEFLFFFVHIFSLDTCNQKINVFFHGPNRALKIRHLQDTDRKMKTDKNETF